jgi:4-amino-4-deoxy-L-arabinose transferase-like glycosyltransferase
LSLGISDNHRLQVAQLWSTSRKRNARLRQLPTLSGLTAWAFAAVVAFAGQSLAASPRPEDARPWLVAAALLGFVGVRLLEPDQPGKKSAAFEPVAVPRRQRIGGLALMALGGLYSLMTTALVWFELPDTAATWTWLFGLVAALAGAALISHGSWKLPWPSAKATWLEIGLLLGILGVAVWLRFPDLAAIPPNLHGDEVSIGLEARQVMSGEMAAVFAVGWYEVPALSFTLHAATMRLFGDNLFGLRMASAIAGVLSVVLLYLLARRLWGPRPALLAASFMAVAAWHIQFSRTGFHYIQAPLVTLLALFFLVRGVQERRALDWVLCGMAVGLSFEVYYAARVSALLVAASLAYCAWSWRKREFVRTHAAGFFALAFGALVFLAPMGAVFARNPASFSARTAGVLITSPDNLRHELAGYHVGTIQEVLAIQVERTLEAFNIHGETSLQYGHPTPLLDPWTGGLVAMSAIGILLRFGSPRGALLALWVWLTLFVGSVLTVDALFSPRALLALPALAIGAALVLERAWQGVSRVAGRIGGLAFTVPVLVVLGLALQANVHDFFDVQVVERQPARRFTVLSTYALTIADGYRMYAIGRADWSLNNEASRFLLPNVDAVNVRNDALSLPLALIPFNKGAAFLVEDGAADYHERLAAIQEAYPSGRQQVVSTRSGEAVFTSYLVDNADLIAANPGATRN